MATEGARAAGGAGDSAAGVHCPAGPGAAGVCVQRLMRYVFGWLAVRLCCHKRLWHAVAIRGVGWAGGLLWCRLRCRPQQLPALHQPVHAQVLAATEDRERKVVAAEEEVARRRRELKREHAARVGEAEVAVRRLQVR